jgi:hypothetical protein
MRIDIAPRAWRSMPFIAFHRIRATSGAAGIDNTISPIEIFATAGGMCAIAVTAKACKSTTFIAPPRRLATSVVARRLFRGQYLRTRFHHAA